MRRRRRRKEIIRRRMRRKKKRKETGKKRLMEPRRSGSGQVRRLGPRANEMEERSTSQKS